MGPRWVAYGVVGLVLSVTLLSGPLVGAVDLSYERSAFDYSPDENLGDGTVDVTVRGMPDTLYLVQGDYGAQSYRLQVPPASVDVTSVEGHPLLSYKIRFPAMGLIRVTPTFLSPGDTGVMDLEIDSETYAPDAVTEDEYEAQLILLKRENGTMTVIEERTVTVEVVK